MTLLEKAKATKGRNRNTPTGTHEEMELVLAWLRDEITESQFCAAANTSQGSGTYSRTVGLLRAGLRAGRLSITLNNQTNGSAA